MANPSAPPPEDDIPAKIIRECRNVSLGVQAEVQLDPEILVRVATESDLRKAFLIKFKNEINDPELRALIVDYIDDVAEALEGNIDNTETYVELIDRASFPIATTAVLSGIGLLVSVGLTLGPIAILVGGVSGLAISGTGRTILKLRNNKSKADIKKLRKFAVKLRTL